MASQAQMDRLLGKALFDAEFRALLLKDPEAAARKLRYKLTEQQAHHIRRLDPKAMDKLAHRFADDAQWHPDTEVLSFW